MFLTLIQTKGSMVGDDVAACVETGHCMQTAHWQTQLAFVLYMFVCMEVEFGLCYVE